VHVLSDETDERRNNQNRSASAGESERAADRGSVGEVENELQRSPET
jgi:hypothetical protein